MGIYRCVGSIILFSFIPVLCVVEGKKSKKDKNYNQEISERKSSEKISQKPKDIVARCVNDIGSIMSNLVSKDTFKTACVAVPLYLLARPVDHKIQKHFYDYVLCKNTHQPSKKFAEWGMNSAIVASVPLSMLGVLSSDTYKVRRSEVFATGLGFTWGTKNLIKLIHTEANKRPCHERFKKHLHSHTRAYGGNPSGHAALLGYITVFWGCEKGILLGLPLAGATGLAMALAVASNRHYLSQVIAGTCYGALIGFAAHTTFKNSMFEAGTTKISMTVTPEDGLGFKLTYDF